MIHFGTAGLRGLMEEGPDAMNEVTVALAAVGVTRWLLDEAKAGKSAPQKQENCKEGREATGQPADRLPENQAATHSEIDSAAPSAPTVTIGYDARHRSQDFARLTATILQKAGLKVFLFPECVPTPLLVYSIRRLGAAAGICVTASHNPKAYNGFKVYNRNGIQIGEEAAGAISAAMLQAVDDRHLLTSAGRFDPAAVESFLEPFRETIEAPAVPDAIGQAYVNYIADLWPLAGDAAGIKIVYTPVHGVGGKWMEKILKSKGLTDFHPCPEQFKPDPDFPTAPAPNPEDVTVLTQAAKLGDEIGADLVLATDPDADRAIAMLKDKSGNLIVLNGNEIGGLLLKLLLWARRKTGQLPQAGRGVLVKSLVTDDFGATIARAHGLMVKETLTGFKNICGVIPDLQAAGYDYVLGYEESIGYAFPDAVRDKDGLAACLILAAAAATAKTEGTSLWEIFTDLCQKHGHFVSSPWSYTAGGKYGPTTIDRLVNYFRLQPPTELAGCHLERMADFRTGQVRHFAPQGESTLVGTPEKTVPTPATDSAGPTSGKKSGARNYANPADFPRQNLLIISYSDGLDLRLRPSGTEPKLKFYVYAHDQDGSRAVERAEQALEEVQNMVNALR